MARITGGPRGDVLGGSAGADVIFGLGGDDTLQGDFGDDRLLGGDGNDSVRALADDGDDTIRGEAGDDRIEIFANGGDVVDGGDGVDTLEVLGVTQALDIDLSTNQTTVGTLPGGATFRRMEAIYVLASDEADRIIGGVGRDTIFAGSGDNTLAGGDGDDLIGGGVHVDLIEGGDGRDSLYGAAGQDTVLGGGGNDTIGKYEADAADSLDGGDGVDLIEIRLAPGETAAQVIDLTTNQTVAATLSDGTSFERFERIDFTGGGGDDVVTGSARTDILRTSRGQDRLLGGDGNDRFFDSALSDDDGGDSLDGGAGVDLLTINSRGRFVATTIDLTDNRITAYVTADGTSYVRFERLSLLGGEGGDDATGGRLADDLAGYGGADSLAGGKGDDTLSGGEGADTLLGGDGRDSLVSRNDAGDADSIDGGAGLDTLTLDYGRSGVAVTLDLGDPGAPQTLADGTTITGVERLNFIGGSGSDDVRGGDRDDTLAGGGGPDTLSGGAGDDYIVGGIGPNALSGDRGDDYLVARINPGTAWTIDGGSGEDTLFLDLSGMNPTPLIDLRPDADGVVTLKYGTTVAGVESYFAIGALSNDSIVSGAGDDTLNGYFGDDILRGGGGDDRLDGGFGEDTLFGGGGADRFRLDRRSGPDSDTVADFSSSSAGDRIEIDAVDYGLRIGQGLLADGSLDADYLVVGAAATADHAQFVFDASTGTLFHDEDGAGARAAELVARFVIPDGQDPATFLSAEDFAVL